MTDFDPAKVHDEAHLRTLPDGTIISWLRIVGDQTSEAVAFVRREMNLMNFPSIDVWISPGGWEPMTIAEAGVTYPCQVVRVGEHQTEHYLGTELPLLPEMTSGVLDHGGTWAREKALECASRFWAGQPGSAYTQVLGTAEAFEDWLNRPDNNNTEGDLT